MYPETIEIPLPQGARLSPFDLDILKATLVSIVTSKCQVGENSAAIVAELEKRGWHLRLGPTWIVTAHREHASEQAVGRTPDEAIARLFDELRLETYEQP
jgi:hypothetical protein